MKTLLMIVIRLLSYTFKCKMQVSIQTHLMLENEDENGKDTVLDREASHLSRFYNDPI